LVSTIEQLSSKVDGVVITHGTDLMEMTSFALSLLLDIDIPVVLTGAMRRPDLPGADGPANLLSAFQVVVSEEAKGAGVLVVMNGEIIPGFFAKKQHSFLPQAFSDNAIGWVAEERVRLFYKEQAKKPRLSLGDKHSSILVLEGGFDITRSDISVINFEKLDAFVLSITGAGHVSGAITGDLEDIAKRIPTVFASRTGAGETYKSYYGYEGSERDLISKGLIPGGYLNARQVRMLLLLAYSHGNLSIEDTAEMMSMFN
jgi:L-asparaginase